MSYFDETFFTSQILMCLLKLVLLICLLQVPQTFLVFFFFSRLIWRCLRAFMRIFLVFSLLNVDLLGSKSRSIAVWKSAGDLISNAWFSKNATRWLIYSILDKKSFLLISFGKLFLRSSSSISFLILAFLCIFSWYFWSFIFEKIYIVASFIILIFYNNYPN